MSFRRLVLILAASLAALPAFSQTFPTRPITLTVPFAAGGPTDTIARIMAERMGRSLGQTIVVENVTGAGGSIAVTKIARATPDGYSMGIGHIGTHVIVEAIQPVQFDVLKDLAPVGMICTNPQLLVAKLDTPAKDLKEFMAYVKANEGKVTAGTGGDTAAPPIAATVALSARVIAVGGPSSSGGAAAIGAVGSPSPIADSYSPTDA